MMLMGFGFLYTLLRRYAWSGVGWNYVVAVFALEWAMLLTGCVGWALEGKHPAGRQAATQPA
jgi:hypothetical protein